MEPPGTPRKRARQAALRDRVQRAVRNEAKAALTADPFWGDKLDRTHWSKRFKGLPNLFRFELPGTHRGLYSVLTYPGQDRDIRIVGIGTDKPYDRFFGSHTS